MERKELIILQGLPGSGKSTLARQLQKQDPEHTIIVSRDSFRHGRGEYWIPGQERYISDLESYAVSSGMDYGYRVILDATNLGSTRKWEALASSHGYKVVYRRMDTPMEVCIQRLSNPDREHRIDETVVREMATKYSIK